MRAAAFFCLASAASLSCCQLTPAERKGLDDALYVGGMTESDLEYPRRMFADPLTMPLVEEAIDRPISALDILLARHEAGSKGGMRAQLRTATGMFDLPVPDRPANITSAEPMPAGLPAPLWPSVQRLAWAVATANKSVRAAQAGLKPDELRTLLEGLPQWAVEDDSIKFEFVQKPKASRQTVIDLAQKVHLEDMIVGADILMEAVEKESATLKEQAKACTWTGKVKCKIADMVVVVAGVADDEHRDRDARLVIDLGGDDRYFGRNGAGPGYASLALDMGGDDTYRVPDVGTGSGLVGVGVAYDFGGHDEFRCHSIAFGAGLAGVGAFFKDGGDDGYFGQTLCQGFAEFGVGLLMDTRGRDLYYANLYAQGAARTMGVGWLCDKAGNDTYRAGDLILNSPLFADVHYSNAQGFASGYREDDGGVPGGIGMLTDGAGDDAYLAETYAQGASYWYSLGSLCDVSGYDTYRGYHYVQASAMHSTAAYLSDLGGNDSYIVNFGAAHAIGHDYGTAFLFDRSGSDVYAGRDSRPGIGSANGVGIFLDGSGEDRYSGPPGWGIPARGSGSLGIFADLQGPDQYRDGLADEGAEVRDGWGVAYDAETKKTPAGTDAEPAKQPVPGSEQRPADQVLEQMYAKATQWGVGTAQTEVQDNLNHLIAIGKPALDWMIATHLAGADRLQLRAFTAVAGALKEEGSTMVALRIRSEKIPEARNALRVCTDLKAREAGPFLSGALKVPDLALQAARAAGECMAREAVPDLMPLTVGKDRAIAVAAAVSLATIGDSQAIGTAAQLLSAKELPIRRAAVALLGKTGGTGVGMALIREADEKKVRIGIEVLGAVGTEEALKLVGPLLIDGREGVRIQALVALNGRAPAEFRQMVLDRLRDPSPLVRAVASRTDPGR